MSRIAKICFICSGLSLFSFFVSWLLISFWVPFLWIPLGLFVLLLLAGLIIDRRLVVEFLSLKTTKSGMNMGLMILLVIAGLGIINYIGVKRSIAFDFSESQVNSLSPQSIKIAESLQEEALVRFFYQEGAEGSEELKRQFRGLIQKYQDHNSKIKLEFVEVNRRPDLAEEYSVREGGGVVFVDYQGRRSRIEKIDEQELTSSLLKVSKEGTKKIYFTSGHGELGLTNQLSTLKGMLEGSRFEVQDLSLMQSGDVPEDADVVAIAGPNQAFLEGELEAIRRYMDRGGRLLLALDPNTNSGIESILEENGISLQNNYVVTIMKTIYGDAINPTATAGTQFSMTHAITEPFEENQFTVFRLPQAIRVSQNPDINSEVLVSSAGTSLAFSNPSFSGDSTEGPFDLSVAIRAKRPDAKKDFDLVVFGDSEFLANQLLYQNLNRDLALNSFSFLADEQSMISITPKEIQRTEVELSQNKLYATIFAVFIPMPLILLISSLIIWFRRRHA